MALKSSYFLFVFSLVLSSCSQSQEEQVQAKLHTTIKNRKTPVQTYVLKPKNFNFLIQSTGKIKADEFHTFYAERDGRIHRFSLYNDQSVQSGQLLLAMNTEAIAIKIEKVNEEVFNNKLNYQSDLLSLESLLKGKSNGMKDTVYRKIKSSTGLTKAELDLRDTELEMTKSFLRSPFSGTIASIKVRRGQYVNSGEELFTVYNKNSLFLEASILESDIGNVRLGQQAEIQPVSTHVKYPAKVLEINPIVDENGLISIKIKLSGSYGLLPGMSALAFISAPEKNCLMIPKQAIVVRNGRNIVFTVEHGLAKWNYVTLGKDNGREVEVIEGIKVGQQIIISNTLYLAHDSPVITQH